MLTLEKKLDACVQCKGIMASKYGRNKDDAMKKFLLPVVLLLGLTVFFATDLKNTLSFSGLAEN